MTVYAFSCDEFSLWYTHLPGSGVKPLTMMRMAEAMNAKELGLLRVIRVEWCGNGMVKRLAA